MGMVGHEGAGDAEKPAKEYTLSISKLLPHCYPGSNVEKYY
jgi:hypothetical protein